MNLSKLHDYELIRVKLSKSRKTLRLTFFDPYSNDKSKQEFVFREVKNVNITNFGKQNVILDVIEINSQTSADYKNHFLSTLNLSNDDLQNGINLYFESSVGAEVLVASKTIDTA